MTWIPQACALPAEERPLRVAELDDLFRRTLTRVERQGDARAVLTLRGEPSLLTTVRDQAARETACCSFFAFEATQVRDAVRLAVAVPPAYVSVLDALVARAGSASRGL